MKKMNYFIIATLLLLSTLTFAMNPIQEQTLGRKYYVSLQRQGAILNDPVTRLYIQNIAKKLLQTLPKQQRSPYHFFVLKSTMVNAFALPGGYIGINSGLILKAKSSGEVAAVMAHEIAHVRLRHLARMYAHMQTAQITSVLGTLIGLAASVLNPAIGAATMMSARGLSTQNLLNFSRAHEKEADNIGLKMLYAANYNPIAMAGFFAQLQQMQKLYPNDMPYYLSTHPVTTSRIAQTKSRANLLATKEYQQQADFYLLQQRLEVALNKQPGVLLHQLRQKLRQSNLAHRKALQYGYALALQKTRQRRLALASMDELRRKYPQNTWFAMSKANILAGLLKDNEAIAILRKTYKKHPNYYPLALQLSNLLARNNLPNTTVFLQQQIKKHPKQPDFYFLLAKVQAKKGLNEHSHENLAKAYMLVQNYKRAILQLNIAKKYTRTADGKAMVEAKIVAVKRRM